MTKQTIYLARRDDSEQPVYPDQSFCSVHEESIVPYLAIECTAKNLIRLGRCLG